MAVTIADPGVKIGTPTTLTDYARAYFSKTIMPGLVNNLVLANYAETEKVPASGFTGRVRFYRLSQASTAGVQALATYSPTDNYVNDGVPPTTQTTVTRGYVDITLNQRGAWSKITDIAIALDLVPLVKTYVTRVQQDAALDYDTVIRAAIISGLKTWSTASSNAKYTQAYGYFERFGNVPATSDPAADWATLAAAPASSHTLSRLAILGAATQLKAKKVPDIGGRYVAVIAPEVMFDLRQDPTWVAAATQVSNDKLYKRATIELDGVVFVEHNNAHRESRTSGAYGTHSDTGTIFSNLFFGKGAFGVPSLDTDMAGGPGPKPQLKIVKDPDRTDPLGQTVTLGWKAMYGAGLLVTNDASDTPYVVNLRTGATFLQ